jgi:hypothetical protein
MWAGANRTALAIPFTQKVFGGLKSAETRRFWQNGTILSWFGA